MKKYLLIVAAAILALPALNSCNKPSGDPTEDAEKFQNLLEKDQEIELEAQLKLADIAEYYAENEDYDTYEDLQKEFLEMTKELQDQYEDQIEKLNKKIAKVEKKLNKNKDNDDENDEDADEDEE